MQDTLVMPKNIMKKQKTISTLLLINFPEIKAIKKTHFIIIKAKNDFVMFLWRGKNKIQIEAIRLPNYLNVSNKPMLGERNLRHFP